MEAYRAAQSLVAASTPPQVRTSANEYLQLWVNSSASFTDVLFLLTNFTQSPLGTVPPTGDTNERRGEVAARDVLTTIFWKKVRKEFTSLPNAPQLVASLYAALLAESDPYNPWGKPNSYADRVAAVLVTLSVKASEGGDLKMVEEVVSQCVRALTEGEGVRTASDEWKEIIVQSTRAITRDNTPPWVARQFRYMFGSV